MKVHVRNRGVGEKDKVKKEVNRQTVKLNRQLRKFDPDLVDLHVNVSRRKQPTLPFSASVTLALPPGQLHAKAEAARPITALKKSFGELLRELKRYKARLRGDNHLRRARITRRRVTA